MNADVTVSVNDNVASTDCAGAGILPFMATHTPNGLQVSLVLAQEDYIEGWNQSGCWSAFEGGAKAGEDDVRAAAREFCEESMDAIPLQEARDEQRIYEMLRDGRYAMRIHVRHGKARGHVTYLVRIPWGSDPCTAFAQTRREVARLRTLCWSERAIDNRLRERDTGGADMFLSWLQRYSAVHENYARLPPAIRAHRAFQYSPSTETSSPQLLVRGEFLEKRDVRVVPLHELRALLQHRGRPRREALRLRYSFVPVLKAVIHQFDAYASTTGAQ